MQYRECKPGKWIKPIGFHCFSFLEDKGIWSNWFLSAGKEVYLYDKHNYNPLIDPLSQIKRWEAYSRINVELSSVSQFELSPEFE